MSDLAPSDYERLVESLRYCVLVHDAATKDILWANRAASELLEFTVEELKPLKAPDMSAQRNGTGDRWADGGYRRLSTTESLSPNGRIARRAGERS